MDKNDYVRGRKRQRRRAPKTRSGCITCKIRRVKCDEAKPYCVKCTSTGRNCDGYIQDVDNRVAALAKCTSPHHPPDACALSLFNDRERETLFAAAIPPLPDKCSPSYEPSNDLFTSPFMPLGFPTNHLPGRAFHYFIHRSSVDLTGPLQSQVWQEHVLGVCSKSIAVQHAVVALSGFHERYSFPENPSSEEHCWRQYYLAVRTSKGLVEKAAADKNAKGRIPDEILISCAIFVTIEILLGNTEEAIRHLESGLSLVESYVGKSRGRLDPNTVDLIGFFARLDLQVLSFSPKRHQMSLHPGLYGSRNSLQSRFMSLQSLPNAPSASLYRLIRRILYWIRHYAAPLKYSSSASADLEHTQTELIAALEAWKTTFLDGKEEDLSWITPACIGPNPVTSHLLLTYHLTSLKLKTALSASELIFCEPEPLSSFGAILSYTFVILHQRNKKLYPVYLPTGQTQSEYFFSLESSIVEALYYTSIKCRHPVLRRCAVGLLRCAGREGVWDGTIMALVSDHVIKLEEEEQGDQNTTPLAALQLYKKGNKAMYCTIWRLAAELNRKLVLDEDVEELRGYRKEVVEERLVCSVGVDVQRERKSVEVEFGWYSEGYGNEGWRYESKMLNF
ncbi:hypothetical protein CC80DRAFT_14520 [Byssothecium circinans]|uniref:Zn(2)-C6 fungal-type domain-containing protein n=1 Tax=Byssothecium circinans TaxID=147558 RepID=A0A6A5U6F7_9PLEO|nr:hypothetical protein CC80DRAFT_14520 [Byssothecium circinans]